MGAFVVFLYEDLPKVEEDDDKRDEVVGKLEKLAEALGLKKVVVCLGSKGDLDKYKIDPNHLLSAVLYSKYKVRALHGLTRDKVDRAAVDAIMKDVRTKLGATR
jgi:hypothetical protein